MHKGWLFAVMVCGCGVEAERTLPERLTDEPRPCIDRSVDRCDPLLRGALTETGVETDLFIDGVGFFPVRDNDRLLLTRDGAFTIDFEGRLVSRDGFPLQAFEAKGPQLQDLKLSLSRVAPVATSNVHIEARLDPHASQVTFDPADPANTSNFKSSVTIYDSLGVSFDLSVYFNRTGTGAWAFRAMVWDGAALTGGTAGAPAVVAEGTLTFDTEGRLVRVTQRSDFNPLHASNPQPLHFDLGDEVSHGGTGRSGVNQNHAAGRNDMTFIDQNGWPAGDLTGVSVYSNGSVVGRYSNSLMLELARLVVARASSPNLLRHVGGALFAPEGSPGPILGTPGRGLFGIIRSGTLERACE
jgi:flagellar hook protein FlgE